MKPLIPLIPLIFLETLCTVVNADEEIRFVETQEEFARELQLAIEPSPRYRKRGVHSVVPSLPPKAEIATVEPSSREYTIGQERARARIQFDNGADRFKPESQPILDNFARALLRDGNAVILVEGHTDSVGAKEFNQDLSDRRAQAVVDYLGESHGIPQYQLSMQGFGETRPIEPNTTDEGRAMNRRVEFVRLR